MPTIANKTIKPIPTIAAVDVGVYRRTPNNNFLMRIV
tara:strand:- start:409 stop:519 length:111 start_codon:yes stop_codon:yes gene_type:complete